MLASGGLPADRVILCTDDDEIARAGSGLARIHDREAGLATDSATLDEVAVSVARWLVEQGATPGEILLTIQPTSPFLRFETVVEAARRLADGSASVLTVRDDRHLRWTHDENRGPEPLFKRRENRQNLPPTLAETGGLIGARIGRVIESGTRVNAPVSLIEVGLPEGLDIDTFADWAAAEHYATRMRIIVRADSAPSLGMGHVHRALALSYEMAQHDLTIATRGDGPFELGARFLSEKPFDLHVVDAEGAFLEYVRNQQPDLTVLDVLDTDLAFVREIKASSGFVVSFEDLGPGAEQADLVINDLYTDRRARPHHWYGVAYAVLAPQFEGAEPRPDRAGVERVLVAFGGTDEGNLTEKALSALAGVQFGGDVSVVLGPGYDHPPPDLSQRGLRGEVHRSVENMAALMRTADLAVTSAGRTVTELMSLGVPTIALCQNARELRHTHASMPFGVLNLGLGKDVDVETLARHVATLIKDAELRAYLRGRALEATRSRSNRTLVRAMLSTAAEALEQASRGGAGSDVSGASAVPTPLGNPGSERR